jgi:site-specific DNA-methyltransferase (adenine-specific)
MTDKQAKAKARQEAGTPRPLFAVLHSEYGFTVDVCALPHNAKLPVYLTPEDDSLSASWAGERAWCNSPYDNIPAWLDHALEPIVAVYLLPVRTDREWWRRWKPLAEVHYFVGEKPHKRLQFEAPPGIKYSSNPDCNCLFCFGKGFTPTRERWRSGATGELLLDLPHPSGCRCLACCDARVEF